MTIKYALGLNVQPINKPPQVASLGEFADYEVSCDMARYLISSLTLSWVPGNHANLSVSTNHHDFTITGTVNDAVVHEHLRAAIKEAKENVSGVRSVDVAAVNINFGMT